MENTNSETQQKKKSSSAHTYNKSSWKLMRFICSVKYNWSVIVFPSLSLFILSLCLYLHVNTIVNTHARLHNIVIPNNNLQFYARTNLYIFNSIPYPMAATTHKKWIERKKILFFHKWFRWYFFSLLSVLRYGVFAYACLCHATNCFDECELVMSMCMCVSVCALLSGFYFWPFVSHITHSCCLYPIEPLPLKKKRWWKFSSGVCMCVCSFSSLKSNHLSAFIVNRGFPSIPLLLW